MLITFEARSGGHQSSMWISLGIVIIALLGTVLGQNDNGSGPHSDGRCRCVCPTLADAGIKLSNHSIDELQIPYRQVYVESTSPNSCRCRNVVINRLLQDPKLAAEHRSGYLQLEEQLCTRCACMFETRNTSLIKVVVIMIIGVIALLVGYMVFLQCMTRSKHGYHEQTEETSMPTGLFDGQDDGNRDSFFLLRSNPSGSMFHRVGFQQNRWHRKVQEQRRNIYDNHTMLN